MDRQRQQQRTAENRLLRQVQSPGAGTGAGGSNARASARLCAAIHEARRLGCPNALLLAKAEGLLCLLEQAAVDEYVAQTHAADTAMSAMSAESALREALVHRFALAIARDASDPDVDQHEHEQCERES